MFKKVFLFISSIIICFSLISCSKKTEIKPLNLKPIVITTQDATFKIDPRTEVLIIACRLAEINAFSTQISNDYINGIDKMYEKYKNHPLVKQLKKASKKFHGSAFYELAIADYISEDFTSLTVTKDSLPEYLVSDFWKKVNLKEFIRNYNDFAVQSNFTRIWSYYEKYLKGSLIDVRDFYDKNPDLLKSIKNYAYQNNELNIVICSTPLLGNWIIGFPLYEENNQKFIKLYQAPNLTKEGYVDISLYQEYLYGINYYLLNNNWNKISDKIKKVIDNYLKENKISDKYQTAEYKQDTSYLISSLLSIQYVQATKPEDEAHELTKAIKKYLMLNDTTSIENVLNEYPENRNQYTSYEEFFENRLLPFFIEEF